MPVEVAASGRMEKGVGGPFALQQKLKELQWGAAATLTEHHSLY